MKCATQHKHTQTLIRSLRCRPSKCRYKWLQQESAGRDREHTFHKGFWKFDIRLQVSSKLLTLKKAKPKKDKHRQQCNTFCTGRCENFEEGTLVTKASASCWWFNWICPWHWCQSLECKLRSNSDVVNSWCCANNMVIGIDKTKCILIESKQKLRSIENWEMREPAGAGT